MKKLLLGALLCLTLVPALVANCNECNNCDNCCRGWSVVFKNGYFYPQDCVLRQIFNRCGNKGGYWPEGVIRYNFWRGLTAEVSGSYFKHNGMATCCFIEGDNTITPSTLCYKTTVKLPTFGLGLKYFWDFCDMSDCCNWCNRWSLFLGAGMRVFFYREYDCAPYVLYQGTANEVTTNAVRPCIKKNTVGGMVNFGLQCHLCHGFLLEFFGDYNFKKFTPCCNYSTDCCNTNCCNNLDNATTTTRCPSQYCKLDIGGAVIGVGLGYQF